MRYKVERYGVHLFAIRNLTVDSLVVAVDEYTGQMEPLTFLSRARAELWIAEREVGLKHD